MDSRGVAKHRRSPSSDRFLDVFSPPKQSSDVISGVGGELNEDDVFWTGDFSQANHQRSVSGDLDRKVQRRQAFGEPERNGILAALSENRKPNRPVLYRKPSIASSSRVIPAIPKPPQERDYSQSMPARKFQQSAPVNVPMMQMKARNELADVDIDLDAEEEMLPPHELVARGSGNAPATTSSVLEGVGRTLKGRDLRLVRNAVWRQTGFLD
ncbi:hypothetical protein DCAR_0417628 [Daucus carota subsp. sativus]|uniref:Uncharacterized protein n=1 Tax=Daucus carota subsp. sativus TaxID=79200 RepID=A0A165YTL5_DAUCS|nr:PREDICTED: uncharacterized protein LOC108219023 [Daucus carota subsp. sativus]WOG98287.1 hypothetical protein DCAR_0417628 [Daucus carota subsp. sativus]